jgi:hypothetical protein
MRVLDNYFASPNLGFKHLEGPMEALVAQSALIERKDIDIVEEIVTTKRILDLHEQSSNTEVAWTEWFASDPVIEQELHRLVQYLLSIRVFGEAESIQSVQSRPRVRELGLGPPPVLECLAAPSSIRVNRSE